MTAAPSVARARSASGRTFDGPQPKRPSAGSSSAGIVMLIRGIASRSLGAGSAGHRVRTTVSSGNDDGPGPRVRNRTVDTSGVLVQAGATWVVALVLIVFQPSTSSGLRGSGPM